MKKFLQSLKVLLAVFFVVLGTGLNAQSAGFNSSFARFNINSSGSDAFYCMFSNTSCGANGSLQGASLGTFHKNSPYLILKNPELNVYKCGGANITGTNFNYRTYISVPGGYNVVSPNFTSEVINGCSGADQKWDTGSTNINLASGLASGNYTFEAYSDAPSTVGPLYLSNSNANYKASFTITSNPVLLYSGTNVAGGNYYATLKAAFDAINAGTYTGDLKIEIFDNTTETTSAVLNASLIGAANYTSLSIKPNGGIPVTVTGNFTGRLIDLNGADDVTINVLNSGGNSLTFENSSTNINSSVISLAADANRNTVTNCILKGSGTGSISSASTLGSVVVFGAVGAITGNSNNTISNNEITASGSNLPYCGIASYGGTTNGTPTNTNNLIKGNKIYDIFNFGGNSWGINLNFRSSDFTISGNSFYQTGTRTSTGDAMYYGIFVTNTTGINFNINGNYIGGGNDTGTGTSFTIGGSFKNRFFGIRLNPNASSTGNTIQNNKILNISLNSTSGANTAPGLFSGIANEAGAADIGTTTGNTVGSVAGPISVTGSTSANVYGIYASQNGPGQVSKNTISNLTVSGAASVGHQLFGIQVAGSANTTIDSNILQNLTTGTSGITSAISGANCWGIYYTSSGATTISNNSINNLNLFSSGSSSSALALRGIETTSTSATSITGNTISGLNNAAASTVSPAVAGILLFNSGSNKQNIDNNTITGLFSTNAGSGTYNVLGIRMGTSGALSTVAKNTMSGFSAANSSTSTTISGILVSTGSPVISNNMISLGTGVSGDYSIKGINGSSGSANYYHNSIFIGGAASASTNVTYAIDATGFSSSLVKSNIAYNARTAGAANKNVALRFSGSAPVGNITNNLVYTTDATSGAVAQGSVYYSNLAVLSASGYNANGVSSDPQFINTITNLHINTAASTEVEGGGASGTGIVDDIDGDIRNVTTPDIGADEGTFISADLTPPFIGPITIANLTGVSAPPTVSVTITDAKSGVNVTAGTKPRLYYKKCSDANVIAGNTSADNGWKYVEATNTTSPFTFNIDYAIINGGGVSQGTIINYFVVAQDLAAIPNVGISAGLTFPVKPASVNFATINLPTGTLQNYVHQITNGTFTLGTTGNFTSLTSNCGCFQAVNASATTLNGNVILNVTSNVTEDNSFQLNTSGPASISTVIVQPSTTTTYVLSGSVADPSPASSSTSYNLIGITGTGKFKVDGRVGGTGTGNYLLFRNTSAIAANTGPTIGVRNINSPGTTLDLNYAIFEGNNQYSTGSTFGAHIINVFTSNTGTNTININNCLIRNSTGGTLGNASGGIYINSSVANSTITNNQIDNIYNNPIQAYNSLSTTISGNSIYSSAGFTNTSLFYGIGLGQGAGSYNVTGNYIGGSAAFGVGSLAVSSVVDFKGIYIYNSTVSQVPLSGNFIQNVNLSNTGSNIFAGIQSALSIDTSTGNTVSNIVNAGSGISYGINATSSLTKGNIITNNTISNINVTGTGNLVQLFGIRYVGSGSFPQNINNNTIDALTTTSTKLMTITNRGSSGSPVTSETNAAIVGILFNSTSATLVNNINGNVLKNFASLGIGTANTAVVGIAVEGSDGGATSNNISKNIIYGFENKSTASVAPFGSIAGIRTVERKWNLFNNVISLSNGSNTNNLLVYGIMEGISIYSTSTGNYWYNSVYIGGITGSGAANSAPFIIYGGSASGSAVNARSNIFSNFRSGGSGNGHYALEVIALPSATTSYSGDYNIFYAPVAAKMFRRAGTDMTFATWKGINALYDPTSNSGIAGSLYEPYFKDVTTGDLHIIPTANCGISGLGGNLYASVPKDIDDDSRVSPTDPGADEFTLAIPTTLPAVALLCNVATADLTTAADTSIIYSAGVITYWTDLATTIPVTTPTAVTAGTYYIKYGSCTPPKMVVVSLQSATYSAGAWSVPPDTNKALIFNSDYIETAKDITGCNCTVNSLAKVTIAGGDTMTLQNEITVNSGSTFTLESDANLIQIVDSPVVPNSGSANAKRAITVKDFQQYNYLISPLIGANLKTNIYENGGVFSNAPLTLYHNEANNRFYNSMGTYILGRGLAVKEPSSGTGTTAFFKGIPMNGAFTYALANSNSGGSTNLGYNLTGNPYPSNIDVVKLYNLYSNKSKISSTFYFWDNTANTLNTQLGNSYDGAAYAIYNAVAGMGNGAGILISAPEAAKVPTNIVKVGQGFMIQSNEQVIKTVDFNNSIRVGNGGIGFFGNAMKGGKTMEDNRFWLNLSAPTGIRTQIGVVYLETGVNEYAKDDSELKGLPSDVLYTLIGDKKALINGRSTFIDTDKIPLGSNNFSAGSYTFSLGNEEGIFANGQNIYLKDKQTGTVTNLSAGNYNFTANAGESTGRFEIIYKPETVLATEGTVKENLIVYRDGSDFVVKAQSKKITSLEVFDTAGRLIFALNPNNVKAVISAEKIVNGVYVLKINQNGQITSKKIIR